MSDAAGARTALLRWLAERIVAEHLAELASAEGQAHNPPRAGEERRELDATEHHAE